MKNLIAKYASRLLAVHAPLYPLEQLFRGFLRGPLVTPISSGAAQFSGLTAINSGTATVTISTAMINSGMIVSATMMLNSAAAVGSGTPFPQLVVNSIVDATSFCLGFADQQGRAPGGVIMWELRRTV